MCLTRFNVGTARRYQLCFERLLPITLSPLRNTLPLQGIQLQFYKGY